MRMRVASSLNCKIICRDHSGDKNRNSDDGLSSAIVPVSQPPIPVRVDVSKASRLPRRVCSGVRPVGSYGGAA